MILPALQDTAFLDDVTTVRSGQAGPGPHLWWLGQSGYLIHWAGRCLLSDPYLSDSLTRKYASTDRPHVRLTKRVVDPGLLDFVDVVTSSHSHTDHLDPETLQPLVAVNPSLMMVCPEANRKAARERSGLPDERILGLDAAGPGAGEVAAGPTYCEAGGFRFHAVPAAHDHPDRDHEGRMIQLGYVIRVGPVTIYHSGDTVRYEGMGELLRPFGVEIALMPINGRVPERRVAGNLWGREAAEVAREMGARIAVPGHYDLFGFNTATPEEFAWRCQCVGQGYRILRAGERWNAGRNR